MPFLSVPSSLLRDEARCLQLLRSIHRRLPSEGGALLIGEMLLNGPDEPPGPVNALMQDLNMMVRV